MSGAVKCWQHHRNINTLLGSPPSPGSYAHEQLGSFTPFPQDLKFHCKRFICRIKSFRAGMQYDNLGFFESLSPESGLWKLKYTLKDEPSKLIHCNSLATDQITLLFNPKVPRPKKEHERIILGARASNNFVKTLKIKKLEIRRG